MAFLLYQENKEDGINEDRVQKIMCRREFLLGGSKSTKTLSENPCLLDDESKK